MRLLNARILAGNAARQWHADRGKPTKPRTFVLCEKKHEWAVASGVAKGGEGAVRPWRHFYGGGTMGYGAVGYKPLKDVLK